MKSSKQKPCRWFIRWFVISLCSLLALVCTACGSDTSGEGGDNGDAGLNNNTYSEAGVNNNVNTNGNIDHGCPPGILPEPEVGQALPMMDFDTTYPDTNGTVHSVEAGGDLQNAINNAVPGDVIEIDPQGTFHGPFTLPKKSGDGWIVIRTATPDESFRPPGTRVDPSLSPQMPNLVTSGGLPVFRTEARAHHYRLVGLELSPESGSYVTALVSFGQGSETNSEDLPHHLVIDRCYFRADPAAGTRRGLALNSGAAAVLDSYFEGFFESGADSQAVCGWNGPGPYRIINNHLEGASENIMFGGADPRITGLVPSDIEICSNLFTKPIEWYGENRVVKNLFELKNARRVLVAGNIFEHNWADGQVGFAVVLTPRNQDGNAPWSTIEDVTIVRNIFTKTAAGISMLGEDNTHPSGQQSRIVIRDNFIEVDNNAFAGAGRAFQIVTPSGGRPVSDLLIAHNTVRLIGNALLVMGDTDPVASGLIFRDNIAQHGDYGVFGSGAGSGTNALDHFAPGYVFTDNVLIGFNAGAYPAANSFPANDEEVGFVDPGGGDFRLSPSSPYASTAGDGSDPGADFDALYSATSDAAP